MACHGCVSAILHFAALLFLQVGQLLQSDITGWVREVGTTHNQAIAIRVLGLHLGFRSSSAFLEQVFSIAGKVWNATTNSMAPPKAANKTLLRKNREYMPILRKKAFGGILGSKA